MRAITVSRVDSSGGFIFFWNWDVSFSVLLIGLGDNQRLVPFIFQFFCLVDNRWRSLFFCTFKVFIIVFLLKIVLPIFLLHLFYLSFLFFDLRRHRPNLRCHRFLKLFFQFFLMPHTFLSPRVRLDLLKIVILNILIWFLIPTISRSRIDGGQFDSLVVFKVPVVVILTDGLLLFLEVLLLGVFSVEIKLVLPGLGHLNYKYYYEGLYRGLSDHHTRVYSCRWNSPRILQRAKSSFLVVTSSEHYLNSLFLTPMKSSGFMADLIRYRSLPWF